MSGEKKGFSRVVIGGSSLNALGEATVMELGESKAAQILSGSGTVKILLMFLIAAVDQQRIGVEHGVD